MPLQVPQLDDRNFEQIVNEVIARIPVHTPEWNNFNNSDPGITLVQLFSFMMENLLYRTNRLPEANRIKFLSLLGIPLRPASPGYGLVSFTNDRGPVQALAVERGLELYAGKTPFRTRTDVNILPATAVAVYKRAIELDSEQRKQYETVYASLLNGKQPAFYETVPLEAPAAGKALPEVDLHPITGDTLDGSLWVALVAAKGVPVNAVRRAIAEQTLSLAIFPSLWTETQVLEAESLESEPLPDPGLVFKIAAPEDPDVIVPRYTQLVVEYSENVLEMPGIVQVKLPSETALQRWNFDPSEEGTEDFPPLIQDRELASRIVTWIRISAPNTNALQSKKLSWIGINAARVIQALRVENERIGIGTGTPDQSFKVANTPVIIEHETSGPTANTSRTTSTLTLQVIDNQGNAKQWDRIDDLRAASSEDTVYTLDPESGVITCGNGLYGKRFPFGSVLRASYEYGGGLQGAVAIGALNKAPSLPGGIKVSNPVDTWGASAGETATEGEYKISRFLRHRDRLVTTEDYRDITLQAPGVDIGRVDVLALFDPALQSALRAGTLTPAAASTPGAVTVMVVPKHELDRPSPPSPETLYLNAIRSWLEPRRIITSRVFVCGPVWVPVYVSIGLRLLPGQISAVVRRRVREALRVYLSPLVGGAPVGEKKHGPGWPLGVRLHPHDLIAVASRVEGVRYVEAILLGIEEPDPANLSNTRLTEINDDGYEFRGIELPWLTNLDVREGATPTPLDELRGAESGTGGSTTGVALPVLPKKC